MYLTLVRDLAVKMKLANWTLLALVCCLQQIRCLSLSTEGNARVDAPGVYWNNLPLNFTRKMDVLMSNFSVDESTSVTSPGVEWNISKLNNTREIDSTVPTLSINNENVTESGLHWNDLYLIDTEEIETNGNVSNFSANETEGFDWNILSLNSTEEIDTHGGTTMIPNEFENYDYDEELEDGVVVRLLGGIDATAGQYPFAVYVATNLQRGCSGVIISTTYILTAASCLYGATTVYAYPGELAPVAASVPVTGSAIIHPNFFINTLEHDVALIKLTTPLTFSGTINRIRLAKKHDADDYHDMVGKSVRVFGFGIQATTGGTSPVLRVARMNVLSLSRCYRAMKSANIKPALTQNCLDTEDGTVGMCSNVDVGGPVVYKFKDDSDYVLVGILSYFQMCKSSIPNLFTRIGPYVDLIQKYVPNF